MVHRSTRAGQRPSSNRVTLISFSSSQMSFKERHMKDGSRSVSQEILDLSSLNLVHGSMKVRRRPRSNWVTWTSFSRSQRSFRTRAYETWFPPNISINILCILTKDGSQKHYDKTKIKFEPGNLDLNFKVIEVI